MPTDPIQTHTLAPGESLLLMLPAGGEIFGMRGRATIVPAAPLAGEAILAPACSLPVGRAWRCGEPQWLTVRNDGTLPCVIAQARVPDDAPAPPLQAPKTNRLAAAATRRFGEALLWLRRGLSAASVKTP